MTEHNETVECKVHGPESSAYVCQHLVSGQQQGFHMGYDPDYPDQLCPDAWCDACDDVFIAEGGWNDRSEAYADIKIVCASCYETMRENNWKEDESVLAELITSSFDVMHSRQQAFIEDFGIERYERWDWYQDRGVLVFSNDGVPQLECDIHFAGTYANDSETFLWAWANDSLSEKVKAASRTIRTLGEQLGLKRLVGARWPASEADGWEMTTVMGKQLDAMGLYRTGDENNFVYLVIMDARTSS